MRFFVIICCLLIGFSLQAQKKVVVRGIIVTNDYHEYLEDPFLDSLFTNKFFNELESSLRKKTGEEVRLIYPAGKKITYIDSRAAALNRKLVTAFSEAAVPYQNYARERAEAKTVDYDFIIEVRTGITDVFRKSTNNIKVTSRIILKNAAGRNLLRRSGKVWLEVPPPSFNKNNLLIDRVDIMQASPTSTGELMNAFSKSVRLAFIDENKVRIQVAPRAKINHYDSFVNQAIKYRLLARNNFTRGVSRSKWFGFYTVFQPKPIIVTRLTDQHQDFMTLRERIISDINVSGLGLSRYQRSFIAGMNGNIVPNSSYAIKGVFLDDIIAISQLTNPLKLVVKQENTNEHGELTFLNRNFYGSYDRKAGRIFSPLSKLEGSIFGKQLVVQSSLWSNNAVEVLIDGKLTALITHPVPTRQYLRKGRKLFPFIVYAAPGLSEEKESLSLLAFQLNRLGYLLQNYYNVIPKRKN